ncbi:hypothetical protein [Saccharothrix xinjiangensis]|uniref:Conjugative transposon protein TcpC n=1 Tax=Saccharothrix xinjiangensis TaxID=204798 RepID=A0ABV9XYV2_9PSEU
MPIRTNRGRTAVYRRLWGWPLRSPRHLAMAIIGFAAVVAATSVLIDNAVGPGKGRGPAATAPSTTVASGAGNQVGVLPPPRTSTPLPTKAPSPTPGGATVPVNPNAQLVADMWVDAFSDFEPGRTTKERWLEGLRPHTSNEVFPQLESVDPVDVPVVIDQPVKAVKSFTDSVEFEAPLEDGKLYVVVVRLPEGWKVHKFDKVG